MHLFINFILTQHHVVIWLINVISESLFQLYSTVDQYKLPQIVILRTWSVASCNRAIQSTHVRTVIYLILLLQSYFYTTVRRRVSQLEQELRTLTMSICFLWGSLFHA